MNPIRLQLGSLLILAAASANAAAQDMPSPVPPAPPPQSTIVPPHTGPNTSNLMPQSRPRITAPIPNPVVRTHSFPIGVNYGGTNCPSYVNPYLFHSGGGHWVQYGYPYPLDLSFHNLQPGQTVCIPAPTWWVTQYEGYPLVETQRRVDPSAANQPATTAPPPAPTPPPVDDGREALRARDYERAIAIYERRHQEQQTVEQAMQTGQMIDRTALRLVAVAKVGLGQISDAVRILSEAQAQDPSLATHAIDGDHLFASRRELRRLVTESVQYAKAAPSRESWELVAVLMEAEGRDEVALMMRQRGEHGPAPSPTRPASSPRGPASFKVPGNPSR